MYPDTATQSRLDFKVPPGASSGGITVKVKDQVSEPEEAKINLEDTAQGWTIRTMGYSRQSGEYWFAGLSGENSIFRIYYDSGTGKWVRENRRGGMSAQILYCSTKTDSSGRLFCGYGGNSTGGGTRYIETSPPGYLQNCINLGGSGDTTNVRGAAVDSVRGFVYFAHYNITSGLGYIKKVDTGCTSILDSDYGNQNGSWGPIWNTIVGMVVDETNGDLYVATKTSIQKIDLQEYTSVVKAGFGNIYGIDLIREAAEEPGFLLIADAGAGAVKAIALDNLSSAPIDIAPAANLRTAIFGRKPGNEQEVISSDTMIYLGILHNNGNSGATSPLLSNKLIEVLPEEPAYIWISAPEGGSEGAFPQGYVTISDTTNANKSTAKVKLIYRDNKERLTYAMTGDPGRAAAYDPQPVNPSNCDKPFISVSGSCDNKDNAGICQNCVGSFKDSNNLIKSNVCGSKNNPCEFEFWITDRYGGDNYKVYFGVGDQYENTSYIAGASPIYTAVKHIHIERDKMCRNGGILGLDAYIGDTKIYISKFYNQSTGQWERVDTINNDNFISIFDADRPYEWPHDKAYALITNDDYIVVDQEGEKHYVEITLKESIGGNDYQLQCNYDASKMSDSANNYAWTFDNGKSAGVCVEDGQFYVADTSDLQHPFSDAFVTFHITKDGFEGSNVVPYLPKEFFNRDTGWENFLRFHQIWFKHRTQEPPNYLNERKNYWHVMGVSYSLQGYLGDTSSGSNVSFLYQGSIEDPSYCSYENPARECTIEEKNNHFRETIGHELVHEFGYNDDETATDWAWCGNPSPAPGKPAYSCGHPNGVFPAPNDNINGEYCIMSPRLSNEKDIGLGMRTDGVIKIDCCLMNENVCHNEPAGRPAIRTQLDPQ